MSLGAMLPKVKGLTKKNVLIEGREGIFCFQKLKTYVRSKKRRPQRARNV
jgi:hypothetical protein